VSAAQHLRQLQPVYDRLLAARPAAKGQSPESGAAERPEPGAAERPEPGAAEHIAEALALDRREHAFTLREAGLRELLRSEGWEDVVAGLQAEIAALRAREAGRSRP
jgi:hypothetical protein